MIKIPEPDTYIINSVDKWVVAAIAHGEPVAEEPNYVNVNILVDFGPGYVDNIIGLQREPADSKHNHDDNQHLDNLNCQEQINV